MNVTLKEVISAVPSLQKLYKTDLPLTLSYNIYQLSQAINGKISYFIQQREQIQKSSEKQAELEELLCLDAGLGSFNKISMPLCDDYQLSPADIENLSKFINFEMEKKS